MQRKWLAIAALSGFIAVALGAFGAHGLKAKVSPEYLATWQTAVQYQMFHTLALLAVALTGRFAGRQLYLCINGLFVVGILLFSGSLYTLVLTGETRLGMVTPLGGVAFLIGWALLVVAAIKKQHRV